MNIIKDPETGFYNSCHAGTHAVGPRRGLISFVTPHSHVIMRKYRDDGRRIHADRIRVRRAAGLRDHGELLRPPHGYRGARWRWSARSWIATSRWCRARRSISPCRPRPRSWSKAASSSTATSRVGEVTSPSMYHLPHYEDLPEVEITAITMRGGPADLPQPSDLARHRPPDAAAALPRGGAVQPADRDRPRRQGRALPDLGRGAVLHPAVRLSARGFRQRRADDRDGRAVAQHQAGRGGQPRHRSRRCRATSITRSRRAAIRRATSSSSATRAARPMTRRRSRSKATIRGASSARWASTRPSSRATTRRISNAPGPATGARSSSKIISEKGACHGRHHPSETESAGRRPSPSSPT